MDINSLLCSDITADLCCVGFNGVVMDYISEVANMSCVAREFAEVSRRMNGVLVAGADTILSGKRRRSAMVLDRGELINISDMVSVRQGYVCGREFNVYNTSAGRVGVVVDSDVYAQPFPAISLAASLIVCVVDEPVSNNLLSQLTIEPLCPIVCVARGESVVVRGGKIVFRGNDTNVVDV